MFLRWYRRKIAEAVEARMSYMATCLNERDIILNLIAPKDYKRKGIPHCSTDCHNNSCYSYRANKKG
jgi:hypothetical protein